MWLINTNNLDELQLERIDDASKVQYAILSHRWHSGEEVSFQELQHASHTPAVRDRSGYHKIQETCRLARDDGFSYAWVDTCCIDKSSSAELTESLNSMYQWYQAAAKCYAYMFDVSCGAGERTALQTQLRGSQWFRRGWTLQELLAPKELVFYNRDWHKIGTKRTLCPLITEITGIDMPILRAEERLSQRSIAQRMSWAAGRFTERKEDRAYSLLGIFDVNMPLLYGEGPEKAFIRLQKEIIANSDDHTIFAWPIEDGEDFQSGLLAKSPDAFKDCHKLQTVPARKSRSPYTLTNRGLTARLDAIQWVTDTYFVALDCVDVARLPEGSTPSNFRLGMFLRRLLEDDQYARVQHGGLTFRTAQADVWVPKGSVPIVQRIEINVKQDIESYNLKVFAERLNGFRICNEDLLKTDKNGKNEFSVTGGAIWDPEAATMTRKPCSPGTIGSFDLSMQGRELKVLKLGFDFDFNPVVFVASSKGMDEVTKVLDRNGKFVMSDSQIDSQYTPQERWEHKGLLQRTPFDTGAWSHVVNGQAAEFRQHSGLWAFKGDRNTGLDVRFGYGHRVRLVKGAYKDSLVWEVHLDTPAPSSVRKFFR